jgi:hypothetical protein
MSSRAYQEKLAASNELATRSQALQGQLAAMKQAKVNRSFPKGEYERRRAETIAAWNAVMVELREVNAWLKTNHEEANEPTGGRQRVFLDEYDLRNALCEPQTLLQRALVTLKKVTAITGRSDEVRGLLDSMEDYLRRNGIIL